MKRIPQRIVPTLVLIFVLSDVAAACGGRPFTAVEAYDWASNVVIARVSSIDRSPDSSGNQPPDGISHWTITVEKVYKGDLKQEQELVFLNEYSSGSGFGFGGETGKRFLLYLPAGPAQDGMWRRVNAGRPAFPDDAPADLLYLENAAKLRTRSFLFGVLSMPVREGEKWIYNRPSARRTVTIEGSGKSYKVTTDKNGIYQFAGLEPGRYFIKPDPVPGFRPYTFQGPLFLPLITTTPTAPPPTGLPVDIKAGGHIQLDVGFKVENSVQGRLVDASGVALSGIEIDVMNAADTLNEDNSYDNTWTDAEGNFGFGNIEPGKYVLVVNRNGEITNKMPFHTFYFPGTTKREEAMEITIRPGDDLRNIGLHAPETLDTVTVSGRLVGEKGVPLENERVKFFDAGDDADNPVDLTDLGDMSARTDADGRFSLLLVRGRAGTLGASLYLTKGAFGHCPAVDALLARSGEYPLEITTEPFSFDGKADLTDLEIIVPLANCRAAM